MTKFFLQAAPSYKRLGTRIRARAKRFARARKASVALEFALVGGPFLVLLLGIIETTTVFFATSALENGIQTVARQIRTGEIKSESMSATEFKNLLCAEIAPLLKCSDRLAVDVRTFDEFEDVDFTPALDEDGNLENNFVFETGSSGSVVLARAFYVWDIVTPVLGLSLSNMSGGHRLIVASTAFRNEPF